MTRQALLSRTALLGLALLALGGCATGREPAATAAAKPRTDTQQWVDRVQVTAQPDEILLAPHAAGLSDRQTQALDALLSRWLDAEAREIVVSAPVGAPASDAAARMAGAARARLVGLGAPATRVRIVGYDATAEADAPLKVGFLRHVAQIPQCGQHWENLTATRDNAPFANYGCAITANMAAQVANPEDLQRPRDMDPADAARRDTVYGKYRRGEVTSSAKDDQATGAISKAIN